MISPTKLFDAMQAEWPLLASLMLVGATDVLPHWAVASAQRLVARMNPSELAICRAQIPKYIEALVVLHQRWVVTLVLAVLLSLAVIFSAASAPLDAVRTGVLIGVVAAILLPAIVIYNGIVRDQVAARALATVLRGTVHHTP